jgi:hypothetical protein
MSSLNASTFHLIVEHFSRAEPERSSTVVDQQLAKLLGKTASEPCTSANPRSEIASFMGQSSPLPWAEIWLRNAGIKLKPEESCFVVEPVQMVAGMNTISLRPLPLALNETQLQEFIAVLHPILTVEGATLENINGQCLLRLPRTLQVSTLPLDESRQRDLRECLPSGEDSGWMRRIMTECQMVLHDLSSYPALAASGVNGIWFWGNTQKRIASHPQNQQPISIQLRTSDPWLAALLHLIPQTGTGRPLHIWHGTTLTNGLEELLTTKVSELWKGQLNTLSISIWKDTEPGRIWHLKRHHLLRFWSRPVKIDG